MLGDFPDWVFRGCPAVTFVSRFLAFGVGAICTDLDGWTGEVVWVFGEIVLAVLLWDSVVFGISIDSSSVTSVAAASSLAVDDGLGWEGDIWPGSVSGDIDSVSNRAGGSLCPAGAAVCGNVLILVPWEIVDAANVSPVPGFGQIQNIEVLMRTRACHMFWH